MEKKGILGALRVFIALAFVGSLILVPATPVEASPDPWDIVIDIDTSTTSGRTTGNLTKNAGQTFSVDVWGVYHGDSAKGADIYLSYNVTHLLCTGVVTNPTYDMGIPVDIFNDPVEANIGGRGVAGAHPTSLTAITAHFRMARFTFQTQAAGTAGTKIEICTHPYRQTKMTGLPVPPLGNLVETWVKIYTPAVVDFSADSYSITAGENVTFTNLTTGGPIDSWAWDFDNNGVVDSTAENGTTWDWGCHVGTYTVNLTGTNPLGSYTKIDTITVNPGPASVLEVTGITDPIQVWTASHVTVTARDIFGNKAANYDGTIHFTSTDPAPAMLPGDHIFVPATDNGTKTFYGGVMLKTPGVQTVTATDIGDPLITGNQTVTVNPGPAATMEVTDITDPIEAGASANVTVTAKDDFGNIATGYDGTIHFDSTDPSPTLPGDYPFVPATDHGTKTFTDGVILRTVGGRTVTATDTDNTSITGNQTVTVNPGPAATLQVYGITNPIQAHVFSDVTVMARDACGNKATSYDGTIHFTSTDPLGATLPGDHTFVPATDNGTKTFTDGVRLFTAGPQAVIATDNATPSITGNQTVMVNPGPAVELTVTGIADPIPAGASANVTVTAKDEDGNTATGYDGTIHFTSTDPSPTLPGDHTFVPATDHGTKTFYGGVILTLVGAQTVTATDNATPAITGDQTVTVNHGPAVILEVTGITDPIEAGTDSDVTVTVKDACNNIATGYDGTIHFTSTDPWPATLPGDYTFDPGIDNGVVTLTNEVNLKTAGLQTVTATDIDNPSVTGNQTVTVTPTDLEHVVVSPSSVELIVTQNVTFSALGEDMFNNDITGRVFTWDVDNPSAGTFTPTSDNTALFVAGTVPGIYTVTATETISFISGSATANVTGVTMTVTVSLQGNDREEEELTVPFIIKLFDTGVSLTWDNIVPKMYQETSENFTTADYTNPNWPGITGAGGIIIDVDNIIIATPTASGIVPLEVSGVLPGTYKMAITSHHNLISVRSPVVVTIAGATVSIGELLEGNGDDSFKIDITDFGLLADAFGKIEGQLGWDAKADYDNNLMINIADFTILAMNYGEESPVAVEP